MTRARYFVSLCIFAHCCSADLPALQNHNKQCRNSQSEMKYLALLVMIDTKDISDQDLSKTCRLPSSPAWWGSPRTSGPGRAPESPWRTSCTSGGSSGTTSRSRTGRQFSTIRAVMHRKGFRSECLGQPCAVHSSEHRFGIEI